MRKLKLTRKVRSRVYSNARIAQVLLFLDRRGKGVNRVAKEREDPVTFWESRSRFD